MKWRVVICAILTAVVAYTAIRIEVLNTQNGNRLPKQPVDGRILKWRCATRRSTIKWHERQFAIRRVEEFHAENPDAELPSEEAFIGLPLTDEEQAELNAALEESERNAELYGVVASLGHLQYILAPATLILATLVFRRQRHTSARVAASLSISIASIAIVLMFYRGYFTAVHGW
jgi:TRAP-type uncharacterized transport system fused permease subunit